MASRKPALVHRAGASATPAKKVLPTRGKPPEVRARTAKIFLRGEPDDDDPPRKDKNAKKAVPARKKVRLPDVELDDDRPAKTARAAVKTVRNAKPRRRTVAADDELADAIDDQDDGDGLGSFEMEGISQHSRRTIELEAQMHAHLRGSPVFPYPPELTAVLKPYWVELVNSFPKDHFQISDITMMKMYCQCAYDIERQNIKIEEEGEVVIGGRGQAIVNPRCKVRESNRAALMSLTTKFRNQPASRQNTANFGRNRRKSAIAAGAAQTLADDGDGLLARPGEDDDFDEPPSSTRH